MASFKITFLAKMYMCGSNYITIGSTVGNTALDIALHIVSLFIFPPFILITDLLLPDRDLEIKEMNKALPFSSH